LSYRRQISAFEDCGGRRCGGAFRVASIAEAGSSRPPRRRHRASESGRPVRQVHPRARGEGGAWRPRCRPRPGLRRTSGWRAPPPVALRSRPSGRAGRSDPWSASCASGSRGWRRHASAVPVVDFRATGRAYAPLAGLSRPSATGKQRRPPGLWRPLTFAFSGRGGTGARLQTRSGVLRGVGCSRMMRWWQGS
jgi:hypothetical protein